MFENASIKLKRNIMEINKSAQFLHECLGWLRLLDFFGQENSYLKTRLSEVVDHRTDKDFLALAEHFQNLFIMKDEFIDELTHDVREQQEKISRLAVQNSLPESSLGIQQKLRNEISYLEKDFIETKNEFNKYLSSVL
jgi:hypothetical protein